MHNTPRNPKISTQKVPQSNFLSTVFFNFDHVSFFGIFCHFLKISLLHWVSATKESPVCHKKVFFLLFLWPTQCFLCRTDSVQQTNFNEIAINAKKKRHSQNWKSMKILRKLDWGTLQSECRAKWLLGGCLEVPPIPLTPPLMSPKRKCHQNTNVTKMPMSPKCKYH